MCKMTPIGVRLDLKNFILISCAVLELLRKVSQGEGGGIRPLGEIGLNSIANEHFHEESIFVQWTENLTRRQEEKRTKKTLRLKYIFFTPTLKKI